MWKVIGKSVQGTSHVKDSIPCQDACVFLTTGSADCPVLIIAIADGAGSAKASDVGAERATEFILNLAKDFEWEGSALDIATAQEWLKLTKANLVTEAAMLNLQPGDLACTLLLAVILPTRSYFIQVGDGCWVADQGAGYLPITWPCKGEFLNYTKFITSDDASEHLQFKECLEPVSAVAGFTDGLQMLALGFAEQKAHRPFFDLFFTPLKATDDHSSLQAPLIDFLNSEAVNERTDDDKTLVLACRK